MKELVSSVWALQSSLVHQGTYAAKSQMKHRVQGQINRTVRESAHGADLNSP